MFKMRSTKDSEMAEIKEKVDAAKKCGEFKIVNDCPQDRCMFVSQSSLAGSEGMCVDRVEEYGSYVDY